VAKSCLLIIDVQKGFINKWTRRIPKAVEAAQHEFDLVVATRFFNPEGSFYRSLIKWEKFAPGSDEIELAFTPRPDAWVFDKPVYSAVTGGLLDFLAKNKVRRVHVCGIATDNCVLKTAADLFERGVEPVVLADACASHGGKECHDCGLLLLRRLIGKGQVVAGPPGPAAP